MKRATVMKKLERLWFAAAIAAVGCQDLAGDVPEEEPTDGRRAGVAALIDVGHSQSVPDEYIVVFTDGVSASRVGRVLGGMRAAGAKIMGSYSIIPAFAGRFTPAQLESLRQDPEVAYIEANKLVTTSAVSLNPPYGLDRIDQRNGTNSQFDDLGYDGSGVHAYIIDTGIRTSHSEFTGRIGAGFSAIDGDPSFQDCHGHGTHVASTVAGTKYGVAKKATVHAVRVLGCTGNGTYADVIEGMDWVGAHGASFPSVVNMSLGGPASAAVNDAVRNLTRANIPVIVAAGNSSTDACNTSPAGTAEAITVGATGGNEVRAYFSNFGACLDLFAPGVNVLGAGIGNDNATATMSGTSMASPHIAGAVAAYLQRYPQATALEVGLAVTDTATPAIVGDPRGSSNLFLYTGFPAPAPGSCYGHCGGAAADFSCYCDEHCTYFGDCCADRAAVCQ